MFAHVIGLPRRYGRAGCWITATSRGSSSYGGPSPGGARDSRRDSTPCSSWPWGGFSRFSAGREPGTSPGPRRACRRAMLGRFTERARPVRRPRAGKDWLTLGTATIGTEPPPAGADARGAEWRRPALSSRSMRSTMYTERRCTATRCLECATRCSKDSARCPAGPRAASRASSSPERRDARTGRPPAASVRRVVLQRDVEANATVAIFPSLIVTSTRVASATRSAIV